MNTNISESMLSSFSTAFAAERANQVAQKAVVKSGLSAAAENQKEAIDNPMIFSLELETGDADRSEVFRPLLAVCRTQYASL